MRSPDRNRRDMTISLSGVFRVILGIALALALLFLAGAGLTRYLLTRLATPPPRPTFPNDPSPSVVASPTGSPVSPAAATPPSPASPVAEASPSPSPSPSPQGYQARITQPIGLIVRQEPSAGAAQIGGVEYNREVTILEDSPDGGWQKIRLGNLEGWVKGGNTQRL